MAAEVHESKEAEQSVIVGIEIAVLKGFVACLICYVTGMATAKPNPSQSKPILTACRLRL